MFVQEYPTGVFTPVSLDSGMIIGRVNGEGDTQWPASILETWTLEQLAAIKITHQPDPVPVPASITRRQLLIALYTTGYISDGEAIAAAGGGAVPEFIRAQFDLLDLESKTLAYITWASMSVCERNNPLLLQIAEVANLTSSQMDDYFRWASTL